MKIIIQHGEDDAAQPSASTQNPQQRQATASLEETSAPQASSPAESGSEAAAANAKRPQRKRKAVLGDAGAESGRRFLANPNRELSRTRSAHAYPLGERMVHSVASSSSSFAPMGMAAMPPAESASSAAATSSSSLLASSSSASPFLSSSSSSSPSCMARMRALDTENDPLRSSAGFARDGGEGSGSGSGSGESGGSEAGAWLKTRLKRQGLEIKKMLGDGNCLFRAVSTQIYGDADWHADIRKHVVKYIKSERSYFGQFITEDFDEYIAKMSREGCYGTNLEIQAIAEVYNRAVEVYGSIPSLSSSSSNASSAATSSSSPGPVKPINIFQASYATSNAPIRLAYINGNHYDAVIDPYEATVGVGLGLPQLNPGGIEKANLKLAFEKSKKGMKEFETFCINNKMYLTDREQTENALEEAAIAASLRDYWESQGKGGLKRKSPEMQAGANKKSKLHSSSTSSSSQGDGSLLSSLAATQAKITQSRTYPPAVEELIFNGFPPEKVLKAYETCGDNFDALLALVLRRI